MLVLNAFGGILLSTFYPDDVFETFCGTTNLTFLSSVYLLSPLLRLGSMAVGWLVLLCYHTHVCVMCEECNIWVSGAW